MKHISQILTNVDGMKKMDEEIVIDFSSIQMFIIPSLHLFLKFFKKTVLMGSKYNSKEIYSKSNYSEYSKKLFTSIREMHF